MTSFFGTWSAAVLMAFAVSAGVVGAALLFPFDEFDDWRRRRADKREAAYRRHVEAEYRAEQAEKIERLKHA